MTNYIPITSSIDPLAETSEEHKEGEALTNFIPSDADNVHKSNEVESEVQAVVEEILLTATASVKSMQGNDEEGLKEQLVQLGEAQREMKTMMFSSSRQVTFASEVSETLADINHAHNIN